MQCNGTLNGIAMGIAEVVSLLHPHLSYHRGGVTLQGHNEQDGQPVLAACPSDGQTFASMTIRGMGKSLTR